jgi:hypothetical protein
MRAVAIGELIPGGCDGDLERPGVGIFRRDARAVAGRLAFDGVLADRVPQPGYEGLDRIAGGGRKGVCPQVGYESVDGHSTTRADRQPDEQAAQTCAAAIGCAWATRLTGRSDSDPAPGRGQQAAIKAG